MIESSRLLPASAAEFWDHRIRTLRFYHGTSMRLEQSFRAYGLSPDNHPFPKDEMSFFNEILTRYSFDYLLATAGNVYISISFLESMRFAKDGCETVREIIVPEATRLLENSELSQLTSQKEKERLKTFRQWGLDFIQYHKPLLLVFSGRLGQLNEYIGDKFPDIADYLNYRDAFVARAQTNANEMDTMSEVGAADALYDYIEGYLYDFPIPFAINSADMEFVEARRIRRYIDSHER